MSFERLEGGLFIVRYGAPADLVPSAQAELIALVEAAAKVGPVGLLFDVGPEVVSVDLSVPAFWLDVTGRIRITAMCIVTQSAAVRIAARGFKLAQQVRKHPIAVESAEHFDEGLRWLRSRLEVA